MRKSDKQNALIICTVVLCFMVTLGLCYLYSGDALLNLFGTEKQTTYYAIAAGGYTDVTLARSNAAIMRQRGGAGYVRTADEQIEVLLAVYPNEETAASVLAKLNDQSAYIKEINIAEGNFDWRSKSQKDIVDDALGYFETTYVSLYDLSNKLNSNDLELADARNQIDILYGKISNLKSDFYEKTASDSKSQTTDIKLALVTALALIENIDTSIVKNITIMLLSELSLRSRPRRMLSREDLF
jgi:hypothetical protein